MFPLSPNAKTPALKADWRELATTDRLAIMDWWDDNPKYNIGVAGDETLTILDFDTKGGKPGLETLADMRQKGLPAATFEVRTPSGGVHVYVQTDRAFPNSVGTLPDLPGMDVRSKNAYVVGPGSTLDGVAYTIFADHAPAMLPAMFASVLESSTKSHSAKIEAPVAELDKQSNIDKATSWLLKVAPHATQGNGGDQTTFTVAARMRDFALTEATAFQLLAEHWNPNKASPPWPADELQDKVKNAFSYATGTYGALTPEADFLDSAKNLHDIDLGASPFEGQSDLITQLGAPTHPQQKTAFHLLTYEEMTNLPQPEWLIEGVVQRRSAALLFGKSNAFKSFLAIDLAAAVASGQEWHGYKTVQGKVLYVATEGANGIGRLRVPAWFEHHKIDSSLRNNFYLFNKEIRLDEKSEIIALGKAISAIGGFELVVFDIFGGTMSGAETEDTTARAWVHNVQAFMRVCGCATLTVAHTGWQDETRARMHTHFWGSFDSRMKAEGDKDKLETVLSIDRHKDADSTGRWGFRMLKTENELSLVPELDMQVCEGQGGEGKSNEKWPDAALACFEVLEALSIENGTFDNEFGAVVVGAEGWRDVCYVRVFGSLERQDSKRKGFTRAKDWLLQNKYVVWSGGKAGVKGDARVV